MLSCREQWITLAFIVAVTFLVVGYDVIAYKAHGSKATISVVLSTIFERHPVAALAFAIWIGILVGHLFPTK